MKSKESSIDPLSFSTVVVWTLTTAFLKKNVSSVCTPVFIAALFTIARSWKQPKCPSTEEWIKKIHIYNGILLSHEKE